jgi:hypothetical protein
LSRKNKSGDCVKIDKQKLIKKKSHSKSPKSSMINAKFHNVANNIFSEYDKNGYILDKYKSQVKEMVQKYIDKHTTINPGDILFVGSTYQSRQYENAYVIINNDRTAVGYGNDAVHLPFQYREQIPKKISYRAMLNGEFDKLEEAMPDEEAYQFGIDFFGPADGEIKEAWQNIIADYEAEGIY